MCVEISSDEISAFSDIGMLFVTIGLVIIGWRALGQIKELQIQNKNEAINQLYTRMFEIQSLLISQNCHDDFFKNEQSDYDKFKIYAQMYADFLEQIMIQKEQLVKCGEKDIWENFVDNTLTNIHVKKYIQENKNLYHLNLTQKV